ncbi:MAG: FHA domain-containing protein [Chloroflexota bacterium]
MASQDPLAKLRWVDPTTQSTKEYILNEGATATIGRASSNDIQIPEQHVSRQHAVIRYRDGFFMINDLASSNGTFVNDKQIIAPAPLLAGDKIRLFEPILEFLAVAEAEEFGEDSQVIRAADPNGQASFIITNGPQEGQSIALLIDELYIGRATSSATWQILIQDPSVSRPHARLKRIHGTWHLIDLDSSNGTRVNHNILQPNESVMLQDGDKVEFGGSILVFRLGWQSPNQQGIRSSDSLTKPID